MNLQTVDKLIAECGSWDDLWAKLTTPADENSLSQTQKGDVFERLPQHYLQTVPEYQSILKHVWWLNYDELPAGGSVSTDLWSDCSIGRIGTIRRCRDIRTIAEWSGR